MYHLHCDDMSQRAFHRVSAAAGDPGARCSHEPVPGARMDHALGPAVGLRAAL